MMSLHSLLGRTRLLYGISNSFRFYLVVTIETFYNKNYLDQDMEVQIVFFLNIFIKI
jgi:hypothetical protein